MYVCMYNTNLKLGGRLVVFFAVDEDGPDGDDEGFAARICERLLLGHAMEGCREGSWL
jgi:hypothetical protein